MLRYILHVITAVLAFMIGVGWVYNFGLSKLPTATAERQMAVERPLANVPSTPTPIPVPRDPPKPEQKIKYVCRDKLYLFALDHLREIDNEYIGRDYVDEFIEGAGIADCAELFQVEKRIDLNGDGRKEIILRAQNSPKGSFFCGATGNCDYWVIRKDKNGYKIILDAPATEEVRIQGKRTKKYFDLVTRWHGGMMDHSLAFYEYNGGKYTLRKCFADTMDTYGKSYVTQRKLSECG